MKNVKAKKLLVIIAVITCIFSITAISLFSGIGGLHECTAQSVCSHGIERDVCQECSEDFCFVCSMLTLSEQIINGLLAVAFLVCVALIINIVSKCLRAEEYCPVTAQTPVCLKVKLSN